MREQLFGIWKIWDPALRHEDNKPKFLLIVAVIDVMILGPLYFLVNRVMHYRESTVWDPSFALDSQIPFIPWTILIYSTLYFVFYPLPYFTIKNDRLKELLILSQAMIISQIIAVIFFVLFPAEVYIRSQAIAEIEMNPSWYGIFYELLWMIDSPYNSWPSLHVCQAGLITLFAIRWSAEKPVLQLSLLILLILMMLSILTTKQHFIWDLITALVLLFATWNAYVKPALD